MTNSPEPQSVSLTYEITWRDFMAMINAPSRQGPWRIKQLAWIALAVINLMLGGIVIYLDLKRGEPISNAALFSLGVGIAIPVFHWLVLPLYYRWYFARLNIGDRPTDVVLDETGIDVRIEGIQSKIGWSKIIRVEETSNHLFLWLSSLQATIIPKSGGPQGSIRDARQIAEAGLPASRTESK